MGRWQPEAPRRLAEAAMELYARQGFDSTTVAEIAARAGLTERTFFRYFADKREVLFDGSGRLTDFLAGDAAAAPADASPLDVVSAALQSLGSLLEEQRGRDFARRRHRILTQNPELQERELIKMAAWTDALTRSLRARGVDEQRATLSAAAGVAAFRVAFARWVSADDSAALPALLRESFQGLRALTAA
jgi:AcrR family transcriptional regulator